MPTGQTIAIVLSIRRIGWLFSPPSAEAGSFSDAGPRAVRCWSGAGKKYFLAIAMGVVSATGILRGQEIGGLKKDPPTASATAGANLPAAVAAARERAGLLHDVYAATLVVMHRHYFHSELAIVPARAMEDVFEDMAGLSGDKAHWISVNTKAMSIDHKPTTEFEKKAASELSAGKNEYELVENGVYQRAAAIPLGTNCVGCHTTRFSAPPKSPRFAGLVISIPLKVEKKITTQPSSFESPHPN